jgi:hypothetical protein
MMKKLTKKQKEKLLLAGLGKGAREEYLEDNPHGFKKIHKVHKSKKNPIGEHTLKGYPNR